MEMVVVAMLRGERYALLQESTPRGIVFTPYQDAEPFQALGDCARGAHPPRSRQALIEQRA
jgi:hypothetical protein